MQELIKKLNEEIQEREELRIIIETSERFTDDFWKRIWKLEMPSLDKTKAIKMIFPNAEEIDISSIGVYFNLNGFKCMLPVIESEFDIYISLDFHLRYDQLSSCKENLLYRTVDKIAYINKVDSINLEEIKEKHNIFQLLSFYLTYPKKIKIRDKYQKELDELNNEFEKFKKEYEIESKQRHEKTVKLFDELIPELKKFSNSIGILKDSMFNGLEELYDFEFGKGEE